MYIVSALMPLPDFQLPGRTNLALLNPTLMTISACASLILHTSEGHLWCTLRGSMMAGWCTLPGSMMAGCLAAGAESSRRKFGASFLKRFTPSVQSQQQHQQQGKPPTHRQMPVRVPSLDERVLQAASQSSSASQPGSHGMRQTTN